MSQGVSHYPISQFLNDLVRQFGPSPSEFVQALGYRNLERGLLRLTPWLEKGEGFDKIIKQIVAKYPHIAVELEGAKRATKTLKDTEWELAFLEDCKAEVTTFVPFIHVDGELSVPNGITIFGVTGGHGRWTTVKVPPSILDQKIEVQLTTLPALMRGYLKEYDGQVPFFGEVTGFKYVRCLDYFQFDKDARFIQHVVRPFRRSPCSVSFR
jgi:hypothetical protein